MEEQGGADKLKLFMLLLGSKAPGRHVEQHVNFFTRLEVNFVDGYRVSIRPRSFLSNEWLNKFAYHIRVNPLLFLKATGIILSITFFTVIFLSVKAALTNPASVLKNE